MKIKEIMNKNIPLINADDSIEKVIRMLIKIPQSALPVVNKKGKVIGEINQRELLLLNVGKKEIAENEGLGFKQIKLLLKTKAKKAKEIMNKYELTLSPDDEVIDAAKLLYDEDLGTIPIVDQKNKLVGVITDICILKHHQKILGQKK